MAKKEERYKKLIDYLNKNGKVSTKDLRDYLGKKDPVTGQAKPLSKASLSEDLTELRKRGFYFECPYGYISLSPETESCDPFSFDDFKYAAIIMILSHQKEKSSMSLKEIKSYLNYYGNAEPAGFRDLLNEMADKSVLNKSKFRGSKKLLQYSINNPVSHIRYFTSEDLQALRTIIRKEGTIQSYYPELESLAKTIDFMIPPKPLNAENNLLVHGKQNTLSTETRKNLNLLNRLPFTEKAISITWKAKEEPVSCIFYAGALIYSIEKNQIYLLGESDCQTDPMLLRLDQLSEISPGKTQNSCFHSEKYNQILNEMFSVSAEDPIHVSVKFDNENFIVDRLRVLQSLRNHTASFQEINDKEIIYTDTIRGIYDFARYLRGFGPHAVVIQPESLRNIMIRSARKTLAIYEEAQNE